MKLIHKNLLKVILKIFLQETLNPYTGYSLGTNEAEG